MSEASSRKAPRPEYYSWKAMITRCTNPNRADFKNYGGRGIKVCDRWRNSFEAFLCDMGPRPPDHTLDRVDNDGNYEPQNCRWADWFDQSQNKRPRPAKEAVIMSRPNMSFRADPELAEEINKLAAQERRLPSQMVKILVEDALAARREQRRGKAGGAA